MQSVLDFIILIISKAFTVMQDWQILPGLSLLSFFIVLFILHVVISLLIPIISTKRDDSDKSERR